MRSKSRFLALLAAMAASPVACYGLEQPAVRKYLEQPGFDWTCSGVRPFRICHLPGLESAAAETASRAAADLRAILHVARVSTYTGKPLTYIFLFESDQRLRELLHVSAYGASEPKDHAIFVVAGHREALAHELAHEVMANLWGPSEPWITEGFAAKVAGPADADARRLIGSREYIPLADLVNPQWDASLYPASIIYPELGSFVDYLLRIYGAARVHRVWRGGSRSLRRVLGKPLTQLEREWQADLRRLGSSRGAQQTAGSAIQAAMNAGCAKICALSSHPCSSVFICG